MGGTPYPGLQVHVWGSGIDQYTVSGSRTEYGAAGWEIFVDNKATTNQYFVQLLTSSGMPLSPAVEVVFPGQCEQTLAMVNFIQTRAF